MDVPESAGLLPGVAEWTRTISFNNTDATIAAIRQHSSELAGVILEAVGQYFIPPMEGYLETIREEVRKAGALFILDEVITGCRLSLRGAQGLYGLKADLATMGKVLGGGMPLGLVAGREEIMRLASPTSGLSKGRGVLIGGGTFSCLIPSMKAGRAMLRYLEEHEEAVYPVLEEKGRILREGIERALPVSRYAGSMFWRWVPLYDLLS